MRAVFYEQFAGPLQVRTLPDPVPPQDGVVVRVEATGICRSDWHGWMGHDPDIRLPHVPGHELAGTIAAVGSGVRRWRVGDRVTTPFAMGCGRCPQCLAGEQQICDDYFQPGFTAWGSFAEWVALPHADTNLVRLPDELDFRSAASLGCRFVTSYRAVVQQGRVAAGEWVAVHGCGGVGLAAVMIATAAGASVVAVDVKSEALALARRLGARAGLDASREGDVPAAIRDLTAGGAHLSLDALGSRTTCRNSVLCLRKRGHRVRGHAQPRPIRAEQLDPRREARPAGRLTQLHDHPGPGRRRERPRMGLPVDADGPVMVLAIHQCALSQCPARTQDKEKPKPQRVQDTLKMGRTSAWELIGNCFLDAPRFRNY